MKTRTKKAAAVLASAALCWAMCFGVFAAEDGTTPDTLESNGGAYTLEYICNSYNVFAWGDVYGSHIVGPVAARGTLHYVGSGALTFADYTRGVCSYIGGLQTAPIQANGAYDTIKAPALYVGTANTVQSSGTQYTLNGVSTLPSGMQLLRTDSYINWDKAYTQLLAQSTAMLGKSTRTLTQADIVTVAYVYTGVHVYPGEVITIPADVLAAIDYVFYVGSCDGTQNTVINIPAAGEVTMPGIRVCKSDTDWGVNDNFFGSSNTSADFNPNGVSIVWNVLNATALHCTLARGNGLGHVVALNAEIHNEQGTYSGAQICKSFITTRSEGHMWPYNGTEPLPGPGDKGDSSESTPSSSSSESTSSSSSSESTSSSSSSESTSSSSSSESTSSSSSSESMSSSSSSESTSSSSSSESTSSSSSSSESASSSSSSESTSSSSSSERASSSSSESTSSSSSSESASSSSSESTSSSSSTVTPPASSTPVTPPQPPITPPAKPPVGETITDDDAPLASGGMNLAKIFNSFIKKAVPKTADDTVFPLAFMLGTCSLAGMLILAALKSKTDKSDF